MLSIRLSTLAKKDFTLSIICNYLRMFPIFVAVFAALSVSGCSHNAHFSTEDMKAGLKTVDWIDATHGIDRNPQAVQPLKNLQARLVTASTIMYRGVGYKNESVYNPTSIPWEIFAIRDPNPNAFSAAPGFIFVTYGLILQVNNEAELAAVISHEMAHVLLGHTEQALRRAQAKGENTPIGFSEDQELAADRLGAKIMVSAGYGTDSALNALMASRRGRTYSGVARREAALFQLNSGKLCPFYTEMESREFSKLRHYVNQQQP